MVPARRIRSQRLRDYSSVQFL